MSQSTAPFFRPATPYEEALHNSGIRLPCVMQRIRTEQQRRSKQLDKTVWGGLVPMPRPDGISNTLQCSPMENLIMQWSDSNE